VAVAVIGCDGVDFYRTPKNLLKLTRRELPLPPLLVTLWDGVVVGPCDGRDMMIAARSSYVAWVSRGSWPKRPKAHGAAVDVGNREKEVTADDEDISSSVWGGWWCGGGWIGIGISGLPLIWEGGVGGKSAAWRGTPCLMAYICFAGRLAIG
jgi:hypothetical protein